MNGEDSRSSGRSHDSGESGIRAVDDVDVIEGDATQGISKSIGNLPGAMPEPGRRRMAGGRAPLSVDAEPLPPGSAGPDAVQLRKFPAHRGEVHRSSKGAPGARVDVQIGTRCESPSEIERHSGKAGPLVWPRGDGADIDQHSHQKLGQRLTRRNLAATGREGPLG
jgi:hypothetical protein